MRGSFFFECADRLAVQLLYGMGFRMQLLSCIEPPCPESAGPPQSLYHASQGKELGSWEASQSTTERGNSHMSHQNTL